MRSPHRFQLSSVGVALCSTAALAVWLLLLTSPGPLPRAWAASDSAVEELEQNRHLLAKWRQDPAHYARLCYHLSQFLALPPEQQERLRRLDRELHEEDSITSAQLWR